MGKQLNDREEQNKIKEKIREAYVPYSESFGFTEKELYKNLTSFLENYCLFLGSHELRELENIAQAIDLDLSKYKRAWLKNKINSLDTFQPLNYLQSLLKEFPELKEFSDLMSQFEEKIKSIGETMSITQVLSKMLENKSWSEVEANYLNERTVEDYKEWLLERHSGKYYLVKQGLRMGESYSQILKQAIIELAKKSKLNAMRAKYLYDISIDTPEV